MVSMIVLDFSVVTSIQNSHGDSLRTHCAKNLPLLRKLSKCVCQKCVLTAYIGPIHSKITYGIILCGLQKTKNVAYFAVTFFNSLPLKKHVSPTKSRTQSYHVNARC